MLQRVLSPVLVGRQEELSQLEDALLSANRGDGRFVLLGGEAGIGKTRLATELTRRAHKLGCDTLWGSCSEAELALPYLPFVEAVGKHLAEQDPAALRTALGPTAGELAQLFPQLADGPPKAPEGDPAQAKLRLFESVVTLLELWAQNRGLLLVLDDVHWADGSTRELLDYAARRLAQSRVMLLATYRSDELDRRHPLTRTVQIWRRSGLAEAVAVPSMTPANLTEMIAAILNADEVNEELASLVGERAEGNPFVLEEMLREAIDRGEIVRTDAGWRRGSVDTLRMPETVREAVLLRLGRLDPEWIDVLRAAAVLGRSFDYALLLEVAEADEASVLASLEAAVAQQLLEEDGEGGQRYTWRHALTQEAIAGDTVVPKRQRMHSRAADALVRGDGSALAVARHLLGAGRTEEAVDACLRAADEAERAIAFSEAAELLERVLPHVVDAHEHASLLARMGHLRWLNGEPTAGEQLLADGVAQLDELGEEHEAARARLHLGRCRWELDQPEAAFRDFESARDVLEQAGPSPELALAYLRISGLHAFELDYDACLAAAERAFEIAEQASADFERVWSLTHVALGHFGTSREFEILDRCYEEALAKGYGLIAGNTLYNEIWDRVHTLAGGLDGPLEKLEHIPSTPWMTSGGTTAKSLALLAVGRLPEALETARRSTSRHESLGASKFTLALSAGGSRGAAGARQDRGGGRRAASALARRGAPGHRVRHRGARGDRARARRARGGGGARPAGRRARGPDDLPRDRGHRDRGLRGHRRPGRGVDAAPADEGRPGAARRRRDRARRGPPPRRRGRAGRGQASSRPGAAGVRAGRSEALAVAHDGPRRRSRRGDRRPGRGPRAAHLVHPRRARGGCRPDPESGGGSGGATRPRRPDVRRQAPGGTGRHARGRASRDLDVRRRPRVHAAHFREHARRPRRPHHDAPPLGRGGGRAPLRDRGQVRRRRRHGNVQRRRHAGRPCRAGSRRGARDPRQGRAHGPSGRNRHRGRARPSSPGRSATRT